MPTPSLKQPSNGFKLKKVKDPRDRTPAWFRTRGRKRVVGSRRNKKCNLGLIGTHRDWHENVRAMLGYSQSDTQLALMGASSPFGILNEVSPELLQFMRPLTDNSRMLVLDQNEAPEADSAR